MDQLHDWLELSLVPGVGPKTFFRLVRHFKTPAAVLRASDSDLRQIPEVHAAVIRAIKAGCKRELEQTLKLIRKHNVTVITIDDPAYPSRLADIPEPPPLLYVKGVLVHSDANAISVVGTRRATHYGKRIAEKLAGDLARMGVTVVSGLAYGIDAAAHKGALNAGGRTIAVFGCGVDVVYPRPHSKLYEQIVRSGAVVSEFPMGAQPDPRFFPMRNRIVSGLSLGTLVVESPRKSGALITTKHALDQGREVFAVPGNIDSPYNEGCHKLIKDGAKLVENVYDIVDEVRFNLVGIGPDRESEPETSGRPDVPMSEDEKKVFNLLSMVPTHIDDIGHACNLSASQTAGALMTLEIKGLAQQLPGKLFTRRA